MTTPTEAAAQRIRAYVIARAKTRTHMSDQIHTLIDWSDDTPSAEYVDVPLLVSDLCLLVDAVLDPDEPTPQDVETEHPDRCDEIGVRGTRCTKTYRHTDDCVFDASPTRQPETGPDQGA